jgi:hypothetical protein
MLSQLRKLQCLEHSRNCVENASRLSGAQAMPAAPTAAAAWLARYLRFPNISKTTHVAEDPRKSVCEKYPWRAGGFFGARAARARALAARARMFVTSQVPFFPNQQYKAVCTLIYELN